jgi:hypothetical protein
MKICFKCNEKKSLENYYKHKGMSDGHLNKCIVCAKKDVVNRSRLKMKDPVYIEKERERGREKYKRLNYRVRQSKNKEKYPWKSEGILKNLSRKFKTEKGFELHHWNYNKEHFEDVVLMDISSHRRLHNNIKIDIPRRIYKTKDKIYLDTREKHLNYIKYLGFEYKEI